MRGEEKGDETTLRSGNPVSVNLGLPAAEDSSLQTVETSDPETEDSRYAGPIIGALVTLISVLLAGICLVMYRGHRGKETPSHTLLATKIQDKLAASIDFKVILLYTVFH